MTPPEAGGSLVLSPSDRVRTELSSWNPCWCLRIVCWCGDPLTPTLEIGSQNIPKAYLSHNRHGGLASSCVEASLRDGPQDPASWVSWIDVKMHHVFQVVFVADHAWSVCHAQCAVYPRHVRHLSSRPCSPARRMFSPPDYGCGSWGSERTRNLGPGFRQTTPPPLDLTLFCAQSLPCPGT